MGDQENTVEHRLTSLEVTLAAHVASCDRSSKETKWWVRGIGISVILWAVNQFLLHLHFS